MTLAVVAEASKLLTARQRHGGGCVGAVEVTHPKTESRSSARNKNPSHNSIVICRRNGIEEEQNQERKKKRKRMSFSITPYWRIETPEICQGQPPAGEEDCGMRQPAAV